MYVCLMCGQERYPLCPACNKANDINTNNLLFKELTRLRNEYCFLKELVLGTIKPRSKPFLIWSSRERTRA